MPNEGPYCFVSIRPCGHAESVYTDVPQRGAELDQESWAIQIFADLRAGLSVKRITTEEFRDLFAGTFLCNCIDRERPNA